MKYLSLVLLFCSLVSKTEALTLDQFGDAGVASSSTPGSGSTVITPSTTAVGGFRTLFAVKNTFGAGLTRLETFADADFAGDTNFSLGYTQGAHTGQGIVTWDGDNLTSLNSAGLGTIDLTQDGGTALKVAVKFFDFPSNSPIDLTVRLYDGTNSSGLKYSDVTVTLNQAINSSSQSAAVLEIPFTKFITSGTGTIPAPGNQTFTTSTAFGPGGAIDITKLGAAQLILNGLTNSNAPDLTIDLLATNGRCSEVPNAQGKVMDECGVCLSSANANKGKDQCGACLFGPPGYQYSGNPNSCVDCRGVPFGTTTSDQCGVCGGDNSSCKDCLGTVNGTTKLDACGVCGGSATDANTCVTASNACVTVAATKEVLKFQDTLFEKARLSFARFRDEARRSTTNKCGIDLRRTTKIASDAFNLIRRRGVLIFNKGVEVCGDSCVTVSYADQVSALSTQFKTIEKETNVLANKVSQCYRRKKIKQAGGIRGNAATFNAVKTGLNKLIADCRASKFCPPQ
jgi:hypothetical protein